MTYKNKIITLSSVIAALVIVYILTIIFDPQRMGSRSDTYSWLASGQNDRITGINITRPGEEPINLSRNGGKWFITRNGKDYPARQIRVEDFISLLVKRDSYLVRSSSASSHDRLSLTTDKATQVIVSAGAGLPLLTLLIGQTDSTGQNVYLRKQGQNEVRSGEDRFSFYTSSTINSWYNLRLFPENEEGKLGDTDVQKLTVYSPPGVEDEDIHSGGSQQPMIFTRENREWTFSFEVSNPDYNKVSAYIRDILGVSGDDFIDDISPSDPMFNSCRIMMELGNGVTKTLRLSSADQEGRRYATVSGSDFVYSIPAWVVSRLFVDKENFETYNN
jgi:hypothetical protein